MTPTQTLTLKQKRDLRLAKAAGLITVTLPNENGDCTIWLCRENEKEIEEPWSPEERIDQAFLVAEALGLCLIERNPIDDKRQNAWRAVFNVQNRHIAAVRETIARALVDGSLLTLDTDQAEDRTDEISAAFHRRWLQNALAVKATDDGWLVTTRHLDDVSDFVRIRIEKTENGFLLHDDGHVENECFISGQSVNNQIFRQTIRHLAETLHGLAIDICEDHDLTLIVTDRHDLPDLTAAFGDVIGLSCRLLARGLKLEKNTEDIDTKPVRGI